MEFDLVRIFVSAIFVLNVLVTFSVYKDEYLESKQKFFQLLIVWFIPLFGSLAVWFINRGMKETAKKAEQPFGGGENSCAGYQTTESSGNESGD